jgi:nicotinamidase-related amidase
MELEALVKDSRPFLGWLVDWYNERPALDLAGTLEAAGGAERAAVMAVDVTNGFCHEGPLASDRVRSIVQPIASLFVRASELGVQHFVLPQDTHSETALEFGSFAPHCKSGTAESETVPELANLPFSDGFTVIEKNSISVAEGTELDGWLEVHGEVTTFFVVGDCTDLCTHQLAMHLRLRANAANLKDVRVILPVDAVQTFDIPVEVAESLGIMPHHGDLLHLVFLYNMAQNGIEIVARVE